MNLTPSPRLAILAHIRANKPAATPHPEVRQYAVEGDPIANFENKLRFFHGDMKRFNSRADAVSWLQDNIDINNKTVFSAIDDFEGNLPLSDISDPHSASVTDICVAEGALGVGETGSVWVTNELLRQTAAALFATDLYLLLDSTKIVDGIHEAYRRIDIRATPYGAFYTGPSATADIEAVHITGAQGEISLTVLLY